MMSSTEIYLSGKQTNQGCVVLPLNSCAVVFVLYYCHLEDDVSLRFVDDSFCDRPQISIDSTTLDSLQVEFLGRNEVPYSVNVCTLPVLVTLNSNLIRSGLCSVIRQVIAIAHSVYPEGDFKDLLGFRGGSLKACAEVSSWTKLCEMEFPDAMMSVINQVRLVKAQQEISGGKETVSVVLPKEILTLEQHFYRPPRIHNDDKIKRYLVQKVLKVYSDTATGDNGSAELSDLTICQLSSTITGELVQPHALISFSIPVKNLEKCEHSKSLPQDSNNVNQSNGACDKENIENIEAMLKRILTKMRISDIILDHLYVEGIEMTLADIMLFVFTYHFIESIHFDIELFQRNLPKLCAWFFNMTKLPKIAAAALQYGCSLENLNRKSFEQSFTLEFVLPKIVKKEFEEEEESELQRRTRSKYRALKPELARVLKLIKNANIEPVGGEHPCGSAISLAWSQLPQEIHPNEGGLPEKRALKKCQQLENLATAIKKIARPGQTIVDFCSGGGHLGITVACIIPYCKVFLIENKEESLLIAKNRVDRLKLDNVTLYQCNLGYFHGKFDIGTCLHACGVATDMVLQKCLQSNAAFVICPCCYGAVQNTHLISYPRSLRFQQADISDKDLLTLGHAADQTEIKTYLEEQGRYCMDLVDTDRLEYALEHGYDVVLCSLEPQTCTTKNNLLIGTLPSEELLLEQVAALVV
ncbi:glutathione S-transferase C-terminal domain-containing protein isoform X1 [Argonauta hians]